MTERVLIDGNSFTGHYRATCSCGDDWTGHCPVATLRAFSPAPPIAEAAAHFKLCHAGHTIDVRFTMRFQQWLVAYWEQLSAAQASRLEADRLSAGRRGEAT